MKRLLIVVTFVCFVTVVALPVAAADLQGGFYFVADCALGNGITFYVPASAAEGCLTYNSSGYLFNISNSTIYLYSPAYPDYTFSASRFSGFSYRADNYNTVSLNIRNITETNVEIFTDNPVLQGDMDYMEVMHVLIDVACFAIAFLLLLRGGKHV